MEIIRTIHPVGQGGFYTESFKDNNVHDFMVAYDCGGNSGLFMKRYLSHFFHWELERRKIKIDAIFISHLHTDHINGLKYLLDNTNVRYLFLPQLTDDMFIESLLYNNLQSLENNKDLTNFVLEIYSGDNYGETKIVRVDFSEGENIIDLEDENIVDLTSSNVPSKIKSGTKLSFDSFWLYLPYNPPVLPHKKMTFSDYLVKKLNLNSKTLLAPSKVMDLLNTCKIGDLRDAYKNYFGSNHNSYSMTLFSGIREPYHYEIASSFDWAYILSKDSRFRINSPNFLYTGDFETQTHFYDISRFYRPLWYTIKSIQVPHHGSKNNYHPSLYENANRGFISVGTRNRYHHPSKDTLIELYRQKCLPIIVTEDDYSKFVSYYSIR